MPEQMPKTGAEAAEEKQPEGHLDAKPGDAVRAYFPEGTKPKNVILEGFKTVDGEEIKDERGLRIAIVRVIDPEDPQYRNPEPLYIPEDQLRKIVGLKTPSEETRPIDPDAV